MIRAEWEMLREHRNGLNREQRTALKESEMSRLAYDNVDPLSIMIHLDGLKLFWY